MSDLLNPNCHKHNTLPLTLNSASHVLPTCTALNSPITMAEQEVPVEAEDTVQSFGE